MKFKGNLVYSEDTCSFNLEGDDRLELCSGDLHTYFGFNEAYCNSIQIELDDEPFEGSTEVTVFITWMNDDVNTENTWTGIVKGEWSIDEGALRELYPSAIDWLVDTWPIARARVHPLPKRTAKTLHVKFT